MKENQFSKGTSISGDLFLNGKQKKPLFCLTMQSPSMAFATCFVFHISTLFSYCCFVSASKKDTEMIVFKIILS